MSTELALMPASAEEGPCTMSVGEADDPNMRSSVRTADFLCRDNSVTVAVQL